MTDLNGNAENKIKMNPTKFLRVLGMIKMGIGFIFLQATLTGGVISSETIINSSSLLGIFFILAGITLFYLSGYYKNQ